MSPGQNKKRCHKKVVSWAWNCARLRMPRVVTLWVTSKVSGNRIIQLSPSGLWLVHTEASIAHSKRLIWLYFLLINLFISSSFLPKLKIICCARLVSMLVHVDCLEDLKQECKVICSVPSGKNYRLLFIFYNNFFPI